VRVAELTYDQAAALDPATLQPGQAITVRFTTSRVGVIGLIPSGWGPPILCGELRSEDGWHWHRTVRVAPATPRGLALVLAALESLAYGWRRRAS
jgi:hypothetical protein